MNRTVTIIKGLAIIITMVISNLSFAQSVFDHDGITYKIIKDADEASTFGTVSVTASSGGYYEGTVVIPNAVKQSDDEYADAYKVIAIDDYAFKDSPALEKVVLSRTIQSIGEGAFQGCTQLTEIEIPEGSLPEFGVMAFANSGLKRIKLPQGMKVVPGSMFFHCSDLEQVILPESITKIDVGAFSYCRSLKSIELPKNLTSIEMLAFTGSGLTKIIIPDKVTIISQLAFSYCYDLKEVVLSPYTKIIKQGAFIQCGELSKINRPETLKTIEMGAFSGCIEIPEYYQSDVEDFPKTKEEKEARKKELQQMKELNWQ